ncbi:unnamed protein product [Enterobius vermicularis]|uniref:F-box domain-containing protein n=1 Tax=Enterobius vermicularis TaxID=51028 RepID=A0A0N4UYR8_ENTVE|nr:unnamed protein product [Enterobius vermicularis]
MIPIEKLLENSKRMSCKKKTRSSAVLKNFADLPDRCILQILEKLKYSDICNLRLVDRRLNLIIQRHANALPKHHRNEMTIFGTEDGFVDFDKPYRYYCSQTSDTSLKSCELDNSLRHIVLDRCLNVENALFDTALRHSLQRSQRNRLYEINFSNCHINISCKEMASFLAHTGLQNLSIQNCSFENQLTISDEIFDYYKHLQSLSLYSDVLQTFPALTSKTLLTWAKTEKWPIFIALNNVQCPFSVNSILQMIKSYIRWCYDDASSNFNCSRSILWNFGYVNVSAIDAKNALKTIGPFVTLFDSKDSLVSAHVRCHDVAPPLFLRFQCINIFANLV